MKVGSARPSARFKDAARGMFREMVGWAAEAGVDYIHGETFYYGEEALIALEEIKRAGLPAVMMMSVYAEGTLRDGDVVEGAKKLRDAGADVVGLNCFRGPATMLPLLADIAKEVPGPLGAMPVAYRTTVNNPTFFNLPDPGSTVKLPRERTFPDALEAQMVNRYEIADFAVKALELGYGFQGVCCGGSPIFHRAMAQALGKTPPSARYQPNMEKHFMYGTDSTLRKHIQEIGARA